MRVLVGAGQDAGHGHLRAADLPGDVAIEIFGRDDGNRLRRRREAEKQGGGEEQDSFHPFDPGLENKGRRLTHPAM